MKRTFDVTTAFLPTPCVLVACGDGDAANIITLAWAGVVNSKPPMIGVSMRKEAHSYALIKEHNEFTVNIPHQSILRETDICGVVSGAHTDKFAYARLTKQASRKVRAPIIGEAIISLECEVRQISELGSHTLFIGEVLEVHVDEKILDPNGRVNIDRIKPFVYCPLIHEYRSIGDKLGKFGFSKGKISD
ncbi:MAG: Flavoredoxin [Syntrophorhabdaceae bacterium PtaU1.Bin034]|nr:MAG: Flavoredoxin [Syntrophorhabdaceae bacterium PtaU1.Bin034]